MTRVVLDAQDADRLLRQLYGGRRPARVHTLVCGCGATADLRRDRGAWNGWQILPHPVCPSCQWRNAPTLQIESYPEDAGERFKAQIGKGHK